MSDKKYVVPEGMLKACEDGGWHPSNRSTLKTTLEDALRWLAENPIVPTHAQVQEIQDANIYYTSEFIKFSGEWQRLMFLAPEPEIPEAVKDLLCDPGNAGRGLRFDDMADKVNDAIIEAFRRGTLSQSEK